MHQSPLLENNTVVVEGRSGVLVVDPGITGDEMACLADDLQTSGRPVVAGFATHPDCDHAPDSTEKAERSEQVRSTDD